MPEMQVVIFGVNNEFCAAESSQVKEIVQYQELVQKPRMPKFIDGYISLRGNDVPIIDLNKRFELGETNITPNTTIIITIIKDSHIGFIVNDVSEIINLTDEDIESPPDLIVRADNTYLQCIGKKGDKIISVISLQKILNDKEIKRLTTKKSKKEKTAE